MAGDTGPDLYELSLQLESRFPGVPPLICVNGKAALHRRWQVDPFRRPDMVRSRLPKHRGNVGMVMGNGYVGIDLDLYKPHGQDTYRALSALGWLPATASQHTQSGGLHLLYRYDPEVWEIGCGDFAKIAGPDGTPFPGDAEWKGQGGYLVHYGWDPVAPVYIHSELAATLGSRRRARSDAPDVVHPKTLEVCQILEDHFGGHDRVVRRTADGKPYLMLTRPDKKAELGTSVSIGAQSDGVAFFFTPHWPPFEHEQSVDLGTLRQMAGIAGPTFTVPAAQRRSLVFGRNIGSEAPMWLWEDRVPAGQLVIAAGAEKLGKSTALVWMCARLTRGELAGDYEGTPLTVAYISAEDDDVHVLKPRFQAAGADPDRYALLVTGGVFTFAELVDIHPQVVVFDPISAFLDLRAGANEHGEMAVRQGLQPYQDLAIRERVTVIGVRHGKKGPPGDNPLDMVMGSKAWVAAARALLIFTSDREHEGRQGGLIFARGNLAAPSSGLRYRLDQVPVCFDRPVTRPSTGELISSGSVNVFVPEGTAAITLEEALGPKDQATSRVNAEAFLREALKDGKERLAAEVTEEADDAGISETTLRRARQKLAIRVRREGFGKGSKVWWSLPDSSS